LKFKNYQNRSILPQLGKKLREINVAQRIEELDQGAFIPRKVADQPMAAHAG
jgi:hypothetical protein